jgi:hypothetical protein
LCHGDGASRIRTGDPLLAKQVLYQLSYGPVSPWMVRGKPSALRDKATGEREDEAAGGPSVPQESEAGEQSGEGHGKPDKPAKQTEERPEPSRAEVSNYFEWVQNLQHFRWSEDEVNEKLGGIMRRAYRQVAERARENGTPMRPAAYELGIERVVEAASTRGYI